LARILGNQDDALRASEVATNQGSMQACEVLFPVMQTEKTTPAAVTPEQVPESSHTPELIAAPVAPVFYVPTF
jgi:hypothetical protein